MVSLGTMFFSDYDLHVVSKQFDLARIAWTPFTGTGGSREPPVPRGGFEQLCPEYLGSLSLGSLSA